MSAVPAAPPLLIVKPSLSNPLAVSWAVIAVVPETVPIVSVKVTTVCAFIWLSPNRLRKTSALTFLKSLIKVCFLMVRN